MTRTLGSLRRRFLQAVAGGGSILLAGQLAQTNESDDDGSGYDADRDDDLPPAQEPDVNRIAADPTDVPPPVDWDEPRRHEITLRTEEHVAEIEPETTYQYMTFEGRVPGPLLRVRRGDTIHLSFDVPDDRNTLPHNIDFHAVYGPGGGADDTTIAPGDGPAEIEFRAEYPGIFDYHCAGPNMDHHISSGMFGAILVEPEDGLPAVDRELYFGQHELYTNGEAGEAGHHQVDYDAIIEENPTYVVLNGEAYAFAEDGPYGAVEAERGERIRVYYANGGPNLTAAVHPIGNVWETLYRDGSFGDAANWVETTPVTPGSVMAAELDTPVPGPIKLVDHAITRTLRKGHMAAIDVAGDPNEAVYDPDPQ